MLRLISFPLTVFLTLAPFLCIFTPTPPVSKAFFFDVPLILSLIGQPELSEPPLISSSYPFRPRESPRILSYNFFLLKTSVSKTLL